MSQQAIHSLQVAESTETPAGAFIGHAKLIGSLTFLSRVLGMARESVAANYFGAGAVWAAFTVAFTIPNLFRKLLGEGALSAAFIPLYAQAVKNQSDEEAGAATFAAASVNLLGAILLAIIVVGEILLLGVAWLVPMPADRLLAVKLAMVMLPYVLLVCGTAFLGGILQVHRRFGPPAAAPILLNVCLIIAIVAASLLFDLQSEAGRERGVYWLALAVLVAGVLQIAMLLPSLRAAGFRFRLVLHFYTPAVRKMLRLSLPLALGAGVLQFSVLLDKGIALFLAQAAEAGTHFTLFGYSFRYPMAEGAAARLNWAQYLYQFPLGIFAIALATAIFPRLSADALDANREQFRRVLRRGIEAALFVGLPASAGLILVRVPAVRALFERGNFMPEDTVLVARSLLFYAAAVWAFSLHQIVVRGYYALHDMTTPLVLSVVTLLVNVMVELPLLFTPLAEAGMAAGTCISFTVQAVVMTLLLSRRVGGLGMREMLPGMSKMLIATAAMIGACLLVQRVPGYPAGTTTGASVMQLVILTLVGCGTYFGTCAVLGVGEMKWVLSKKERGQQR